jgi:uncharacterized Zn-binding protein involved in type VI secretion
MSQPAAALGDPAAHFGFIALGSPNVFIGNRPAARVGDTVICPTHGPGVIASGSATVFINGMAAARMLDVTGCLTIGIAAVSVPAVIKPVINHYSFVDDEKQTVADFDKDGGQMIAYAEHSRTDSNNDGKLDTDDYSAAALRVRGVTKPPANKKGDRALSGDEEYDLLYASAKSSGTTWTNDSFSSNSSMEFSGLKASASTTYGKPSDGKNAAAKVSSTIQVAHAELKANVFSGNNDDMIGSKVDVGAGYETMKGELAATGTLPSIYGYNIQGTAKASGSVESVGAAAGAGLYYNKKEKRVYASLDVGVALGLGLEGAFEISVGQEYAPEDAPAPKPTPKSDPYVNTPGFGKGGLPVTIMLGNMRVLIG